MSARDIMEQVRRLPPSEIHELSVMIAELDEQEVDARLESAVHEGKYSQLAGDALQEIDAGETMPLDEFVRHQEFQKTVR